MLLGNGDATWIIQDYNKDGSVFLYPYILDWLISFVLEFCSFIFSASRYLSDRRAECISGFWTAHCGGEGDKEIYLAF